MVSLWRFHLDLLSLRWNVCLVYLWCWWRESYLSKWSFVLLVVYFVVVWRYSSMKGVICKLVSICHWKVFVLMLSCVLGDDRRSSFTFIANLMDDMTIGGRVLLVVLLTVCRGLVGVFVFARRSESDVHWVCPIWLVNVKKFFLFSVKCGQFVVSEALVNWRKWMELLVGLTFSSIENGEMFMSMWHFNLQNDERENRCFVGQGEWPVDCCIDCKSSRDVCLLDFNWEKMEFACSVKWLMKEGVHSSQHSISTGRIGKSSAIHQKLFIDLILNRIGKVVGMKMIVWQRWSCFCFDGNVNVWQMTMKTYRDKWKMFFCEVICVEWARFLLVRRCCMPLQMTDGSGWGVDTLTNSHRCSSDWCWRANRLISIDVPSFSWLRVNKRLIDREKMKEFN